MNEEQELNLSSRKRRIAAFMIDHFIMSFLLTSIIFLSLGLDFMDEFDEAKLKSIILGVMLPGLFLYFAKDSINGNSIGKWIMEIMVRDANDQHVVPSFGRLLGRNLFIIIWPIEFIILAISPEKKRLGDKIFNTLVVKNPNKSTKLPRVLALIGIGLAFFTFMFLFSGSVMKNTDAYKAAVEEIEQNQEVLDETNGIKGYGLFPTGSVRITNGFGEAQFEIKVLGNKKNLDVNVFLTKESDGEWELMKMYK